MLLVLGVSSVVRDLVQPYKTAYDQNDRWFAHWLWNDKGHNAQLVCVKNDLGKDFFPLNFEMGHSAQYLCNQRIYSPRHGAGSAPPDWDGISAQRPLRCVIYSVPGLERNETEYEAWLKSMRERFELRDHERHVVNARTMYEELFEIMEFVPRRGEASAEMARQPEMPPQR